MHAFITSTAYGRNVDFYQSGPIKCQDHFRLYIFIAAESSCMRTHNILGMCLSHKLMLLFHSHPFCEPEKMNMFHPVYECVWTRKNHLKKWKFVTSTLSAYVCQCLCNTFAFQVEYTLLKVSIMWSCLKMCVWAQSLSLFLRHSCVLAIMIKYLQRCGALAHQVSFSFSVSSLH